MSCVSCLCVADLSILIHFMLFKFLVSSLGGQHPFLAFYSLALIPFFIIAFMGCNKVVVVVAVVLEII